MVAGHLFSDIMLERHAGPKDTPGFGRRFRMTDPNVKFAQLDETRLAKLQAKDLLCHHNDTKDF